MRVAAVQAPLLPAASMDAIGLICARVSQCEAEGIEVLCCPEAILGGLADYCESPTRFALSAKPGRLESVFSPFASDTLTTILGFTELADEGRLYNSAAVFQRGTILGVYRKWHPAIRRSVYSEGSAAPVFQIGDRRCGIVICNDSNYAEPVRQMTALSATVLFIPTNNGLPVDRDQTRIAAQARKVDIALAVENNLWVVRADVAGKADGLVSYGSSAIVGPGGGVLKSGRPMAEDFIVSEIRDAPR